MDLNRRTMLRAPMVVGAALSAGPRAHASTGMGRGVAASASSTSETDIDQLITDAFFYAFPVHDLARVRWGATANLLNPQRVKVNQLSHARRLLTAQDRGVTRPNNDTLYSSAWLDLSQGPISLHLPDMGTRYWSLAFMDPLTDNVACLSRRTSGGAARMLWLSSPGTDLPAPSGQTPIRLPAHDIWLLARLLVDGDNDLPAVNALQDSMRLDAPPGERRWSSRPQERDASAFITFTNDALGRNPVLMRDAALLRRVSTVGLVPGDLAAWERLSPDIRAAWERLLPTLMERLRAPNPAMRTILGPGWLSGLDHIGRFGTDYEYRARVALGGLGALEREEAIYATAFVDAQSRPLNGAFAYRLNVPSGLPVSGFWSLSMYRSEADGRAFFVPNALNRFTVGDRTPGLAREPDGSLVISIQHTAPSSAEHRANWLPAPAGPFNLSWRLYEPGRPLLNRSVSLPGIERLA